MSVLHKIRLYKRKPTPKNKAILVLAYVGTTDDVGTVERSLRGKGVTHEHIAERDMDDVEIQVYEQSPRIVFHWYETWEWLIKDELDITKNDKWVEKLCILGGFNTLPARPETKEVEPAPATIKAEPPPQTMQQLSLF